MKLTIERIGPRWWVQAAYTHNDGQVHYCRLTVTAEETSVGEADHLTRMAHYVVATLAITQGAKLPTLSEVTRDDIQHTVKAALAADNFTLDSLKVIGDVREAR